MRRGRTGKPFQFGPEPVKICLEDRFWCYLNRLDLKFGKIQENLNRITTPPQLFALRFTYLSQGVISIQTRENSIDTAS